MSMRLWSARICSPNERLVSSMRLLVSSMRLLVSFIRPSNEWLNSFIRSPNERLVSSMRLLVSWICSLKRAVGLVDAVVDGPYLGTQVLT